MTETMTLERDDDGNGEGDVFVSTGRPIIRFTIALVVAGVVLAILWWTALFMPRVEIGGVETSAGPSESRTTRLWASASMSPLPNDVVAVRVRRSDQRGRLRGEVLATDLTRRRIDGGRIIQFVVRHPCPVGVHLRLEVDVRTVIGVRRTVLPGRPIACADASYESGGPGPRPPFPEAKLRISNRSFALPSGTGELAVEVFNFGGAALEVTSIEVLGDGDSTSVRGRSDSRRVSIPSGARHSLTVAYRCAQVTDAGTPGMVIVRGRTSEGQDFYLGSPPGSFPPMCARIPPGAPPPR